MNETLWDVAQIPVMLPAQTLFGETPQRTMQPGYVLNGLGVTYGIDKITLERERWLVIHVSSGFHIGPVFTERQQACRFGEDATPLLDWTLPLGKDFAAALYPHRKTLVNLTKKHGGKWSGADPRSFDLTRLEQGFEDVAKRLQAVQG